MLLLLRKCAQLETKYRHIHYELIKGKVCYFAFAVSLNVYRRARISYAIIFFLLITLKTSIIFLSTQYSTLSIFRISNWEVSVKREAHEHEQKPATHLIISRAVFLWCREWGLSRFIVYTFDWFSIGSRHFLGNKIFTNLTQALQTPAARIVRKRKPISINTK